MEEGTEDLRGAELVGWGGKGGGVEVVDEGPESEERVWEVELARTGGGGEIVWGRGFEGCGCRCGGGGGG